MANLASISLPNGTFLNIGGSESTKIMALIGSTSRADQRVEEEKIEKIRAAATLPDIIADLSLRESHIPLWRRVLDAEFPAATLPIYTTHRISGHIDPTNLLELALEQMEGGVGMITIHPTARGDIIELARHRIVPWTSRGGGLVIADLLRSKRPQNVYLEILPDLSAAAKKHGVAISIGATFRSATILDSNDPAQQAEIQFQIEIAKSLVADGCSVIIEGPGHASPNNIADLARRMMLSECPIMPLGPIPTDMAAGQDHISASIGATLMGLAGAAHILAAVTREEHTGGVPNIGSTLEAIEAAKVAARIIDLHRFGPKQSDVELATHRATHHTCVDGRHSPGCDRCGDACPLVRDVNLANAN